MARYDVQVSGDFPGEGVSHQNPRRFDDPLDALENAVAELRDAAHLFERDGTPDGLLAITVAVTISRS